ncbi:hypothetical protein [Sulfuracidifex tepidarius]|uniref:hypothetical protein n=1 Tax=Sulfuracidifex tepidarius TaxID=1294262 RepID=UPI0006D05630|nr:hypothetical protein [Sulfuracidifex tepidarius]
MFFDIFRKSSNNEGSGYVTDDFGEWMLISHNKELLLATNLVSKAIRKAGVKDFDLYLGYFSTDERIKSLVGIKGMAVTKDNKKNIDVRTSMRSIAGDDVIVIEDQPHSVSNICNSTFIFFNFLLLIKKGKEYKHPVKLLLPPMGINPSEIPLSLTSLFKTLLERNLNAVCSLNEVDASDGSRLKLMATCRTESSFDTEKVKNALSYFAPEKPKLFTKRVGTRDMEVNLYIQQLNVKFFIPLLWNNFLEQLRC